MPTRNISLTDRYDGFVAQQIELGRFKNASEVVRAGLYLLERQQREDEARLEALRQAARVGYEDYLRGNFIDITREEDLDRMFDEIAREVDDR